METYTHTFAIPPTITAITMGENDLTLGTDYTYEEGCLNVYASIFAPDDNTVYPTLFLSRSIPATITSG